MMAVAKVYIRFNDMTADEVKEKFMDSMEHDFLILPASFLRSRIPEIGKSPAHEREYIFLLDEVYDE